MMEPSRSRTLPPRVRRALALVVAAVASVAFVATRPWSSHNSFRQMRLFSPSVRVENFRTMDEIFPARVIHRAPVPHLFTVKRHPLPAAFFHAGRRIETEAFLERTVTTGLLVLQENSILSERYFLGATPETPMTSWSVAKSVVSLLVGIALAEGHLSALGAPLSEFAPELRGSAYGQVPLRDALTMSSGIAFSERYDDPLSDIHTMFARIFYLRESAAHYLASRDSEAAPGSRFHYASTDTFAIGIALRHAVGKPLSKYLEEQLWGPLGMEFDATWNTESEDGDELSFCCLNVRLRDYAKLGRLAARRGDWDGKRIVPEEWIRESTRTDPARAPGTLPDVQWGYQYQWWIPTGDGTFMAAGVWGQFIHVDPSRALVIVKTSVDPDFAAHGDETVAFFRAIRDSL